MSSLIQKSTENIWSAIVRYRALEQMFYCITRDLGTYSRDEEEYRNACDIVHHRIVRKELDAWRNLMMMSLTEKDQNTLDEIKKAVYNRFMSDKHGIMYLMEPTLQTPGGWSANEEDAFRQEVKEAFGIK